MSWIKLTSISLVKDSHVVTIKTNTTSGISVGDALLVDESTVCEIIGVFAAELHLRDVWNHDSKTDVSATIVPTFGDFNDAVEQIRNLKKVANSNLSSMEDWGTKTGTVDFVDSSGANHTFRTAKQMDDDVKEKEDKVDAALLKTTNNNSEAMRQLIRDKYASSASGVVHMGKHSKAAGAEVVNQGMWMLPGDKNATNRVFFGASGADATGSSETDEMMIHVAGHEFHIITEDDSSTARAVFHLEQAPDGTETYNSATGAVVKHADAATAFTEAAKSDDVEVITHPVDLLSIEVFAQEITKDKPEVYPYGMLGSSVSHMEGIPTIDSKRPDSYHAQFAGQTGMNKKCLDLHVLSFAQQALIMANPKYHIEYTAEGKLIQWVPRIRDIRGASNGDFDVIMPNDKSHYFGGIHPEVAANPQGSSDGVDAPKVSYWTPTNGTVLWQVDNPHKGAWKASSGYGGKEYVNSVNGECYLLVLASVSRLNQGGYDYHHNYWGAAAFARSENGQATRDTWESLNGIDKPSNTEECFGEWLIYGSPVTKPSRYKLGTGNSGSSQSSASGRTDNARYFDAIYADGHGGIIDYRMSVRKEHATSDFAQAIRSRVLNSSYRGVEKLIKTKVHKATVSKTGTYNSGYYFHVVEIADMTAIMTTKIGSYVFNETKNTLMHIACYRSSGSLYVTTNSITSVLPNIATPASGMGIDQYKDTDVGDVVYIIAASELNVSVSGSFTRDDVVSIPAEILKNPDLKDGWLGGYGGVTVDGTAQYNIPRKAINVLAVTKRLFTEDAGATWLAGSTGAIDEVTNNKGMAGAPTRSTILSYDAFAKQTKESSNPVVLNGSNGVLGLSFLARSDYSILMESLIGRIGVSSITGDVGDINIQSAYIDNRNQFGSSGGSVGRLIVAQPPTHAPINFPHSNNSPAAKILFLQTSDNGQCSLVMQTNELYWDAAAETANTGSGWGDTISGNNYSLPHGEILLTDSGTATHKDRNKHDVLNSIKVLAINYAWADDTP